jgi:carbonic anhydrase
MDPIIPGPLSRRRMFALTAGALAAGGVLPRLLHADEEAALWPQVLTPEEALKRLMDGNGRFASGHPEAPNRSLARLRDLAQRDVQNPFAAVLSCADSRVPVEVLFDQGFGDVFVCRSAGNVVTSELIGSLEYGTQVLRARVLMVLGHTLCGAVKEAIANNPVPGQISSLFARIRPAVQRGGGDWGRSITENARIQAELLAESSPVIARRIADRELKVVAAVCNLLDGSVRLV